MFWDQYSQQESHLFVLLRGFCFELLNSTMKTKKAYFILDIDDDKTNWSPVATIWNLTIADNLRREGTFTLNDERDICYSKGIAFD